MEDEPAFFSIVQGAMQMEGFEVEVAYDGVQAMETVKAPPPSAMVLYAILPEKVGYAVCKAFKSNIIYADHTCNARRCGIPPRL